MTSIIALLIIVLPVFLLVGAGYAAVRTKIFPDAGIDFLVKFATNIAIPTLLFRAMLTLDLGAALSPATLLSFYAGATVCFFTAILLSRRVWLRRPGESVAVGFLALFSNSVLLGIPIMTRAYGPEALEPMFAIIAIHAPYCYLLGILTMELSRQGGSGVRGALLSTARSIAGNALTVGLALGLTLNLSGIGLAEPARATVDMLATAALPVALFGLGGALTRYALKAEVTESLMAAGLSLVVHPGIAFVLTAWVFDLPEAFVRAAVVTSAMPTGINGYVFAHMYGRAVGTAASTVLLGTLLSVLSITVWLAILGGARMG